jgi:FimV-like protein
MISLILKSYMNVLLAVGIGSLLLFISGLVFIFGRHTSVSTTDGELQAIAGDDLIATQLDLARAYIETANADLAKSILKKVLKQGNKGQQDEARELLALSCS